MIAAPVIFEGHVYTSPAATVTYVTHSMGGPPSAFVLGEASASGGLTLSDVDLLSALGRQMQVKASSRLASLLPAILDGGDLSQIDPTLVAEAHAAATRVINSVGSDWNEYAAVMSSILSSYED